MIYGYYYKDLNQLNSFSKEAELKAQKVDVILSDTFGDRVKKRYHLEKLMNDLKEGDTIVFVNLIDTGLNTKNLLHNFNRWGSLGIQYKVISIPVIDTNREWGQELKRIISILASYEIKSNDKKGRSRGLKGGRKLGLSEQNSNIAKEVTKLYLEGILSTVEIMEATGIKSRATIYKYLRHERIEVTSFTSNEIRKKYLEITKNTRPKSLLGQKDIYTIKSAIEIIRNQEKNIINLIKNNPEDFALLKKFVEIFSKF